MTREDVEALRRPRPLAARDAIRSLAFCSLIACGGILLAGCSRTPAGRIVVAGRTVKVGGARQTVRLSIPAPGAGLLSVEIKEQGISVVAQIDTPDDKPRQAASPIERLGTITLARRVLPGQSVPIRIQSMDSLDITGKVRLSAQLLPAASPEARARRFLAAAGLATARRAWASAFNDFLAASRLLATLHRRGELAATRQAMAELAYGYLQRDRDGIALVDTTLTDVPATEPAILGTRLVLLAKALIALPDSNSAQVQRARALLSAAARYFRATPLGRRELPRLRIIEGFIAYRDGHLNEADRLFNLSAARCKALGDWKCYAQARQNVAALAQQQQNYAAALTAFAQALKPLDAERMPLLIADISSNSARLDSRLGLFRRSARAQERAMRLYARLDHCDRVRRSAASLGGMLVEVGSIASAEVYLQQAVGLSCAQLLSAVQGTDTLAPPFAEAASVTPDDGFDRLSAPGLARRSSPRAICARPTFAASTQIARIAVFQALLYLSQVAQEDNHLNGASLCLTAAAGYTHDIRTQVKLINARGELELARRRPRVARRDFKEALRLSRATALAQGIEYQGETEIDLAKASLALRNSSSARRYAQAALRLASTNADVTHVVAALRLLALSEAASEHFARATRTLQAAIGLIEQVPTRELDVAQRATYLATQYSTFADLTDLLARKSDTRGSPAWTAFSVAEQGHARSLRYAIAQAARERTPTPTQSGSSVYGALLRKLAAAAERGSADHSGALLRNITQFALPAAKIALPLNRLDLAKVLERLHATLVEYVVGRDEMLAFVTNGKHMRVARLGSLRKIAAAAAALNERLQSPEQVPFEIRAAARQLARLIWWPIRSDLTHNHIIVVPDGTLFRIPFNILPWTKARSSTLVLQHAQISEEPSALLLTERTEPARIPRGAQRFVLFGDPVLRDNQWYQRCDDHPLRGASAGIPRAIKAAFAWSRFLPSLPGTRTEVLAVSKIMRRWRPAARIESFLGCAATPEALREAAPRADVLHIATHGLVDARRPRLSALALTADPPSGADAAFRLMNILQLRLQARLVVLSACDSSRGRVLPGEGVLGLAQAFLEAGAESVVASYWRVQDAATVQFMESFYRHLFRGGLSVAAALRETQLEIAAHSRTYNWAAFGVYGRPDLHP